MIRVIVAFDISRIKILRYIVIQRLRLSRQNQFLSNILRWTSRWQAEIYRDRTDRWNATKHLRADCPLQSPVRCECARPWNQGSRAINSAEDVPRERTFVLARLSCFLQNVRACWIHVADYLEWIVPATTSPHGLLLRKISLIRRHKIDEENHDIHWILNLRASRHKKCLLNSVLYTRRKSTK